MKSFLAVDFGAGSLKLAEFEVTESGGLRLTQFGFKPLGPEGAMDSKREAVILKALQELLAEKTIKAKSVNVCAPGFHVFSKFVKLPAVDSSKVTQIIQYEAQQNVPFPLEDVVWDYQILGSTAGGELEILLVAIKSEIVEGLFRVVDQAGLALQVADVSPAALCNAFRYNYGDLEECTMLLDIGAKTSNLLFFEKGKVFSRSINIGANSITQDFASESKLPFAQAEQVKISEGFVSLGGAYEEPESARQAAISKIARQFMTRLHIQVNQTMQFYRGQQGGSPPKRLFLSGGASIMTYTAQFFAEKLSVPVEYFNPLRNVEIDPAINLEELARVAHSLGEVVGLGLRNLAHCPVELNLVPKSTRRWQAFNQKKPYFVATVFCLTLVVFSGGYLFKRLAEVKRADLADVNGKADPLKRQEVQFKNVMADLKRLQQESDQLTTWMEDRFYWANVLTELRRVLIQTEDASKQKLGVDIGIWVEKLTTTTPSAGLSAFPGSTPGAETSPGPGGGMSGWSDEARIRFMKRYGIAIPGGPAGPPGMGPPPGGPAPDAAAPAPAPADAATAAAQPGDTNAAPDAASGAATAAKTNEISSVTLVCRAVSLTRLAAPAGNPGNNAIGFAFLNELKTSALTAPDDPKGGRTDFVGDIGQDEEPGTFTFTVNWKLKRPIKL